MENKRMRILWSISLFVIAMGSLFLSIPNILCVELPEVVKVIVGICDLAVIPVLVYTSIKLNSPSKG